MRWWANVSSTANFSLGDSNIGNRFTVVTGTVGSGKTTLLRALVGWLPPQSGTVRWNGSEVGQDERVLAPPSCAYLSQVPSLFSERLRANILVGLPDLLDRLEIDWPCRT